MEFRPILPGEENLSGALAYQAKYGTTATSEEVVAFLDVARQLGTDLSLQVVAVVGVLRAQSSTP